MRPMRIRFFSLQNRVVLSHSLNRNSLLSKNDKQAFEEALRLTLELRYIFV